MCLFACVNAHHFEIWVSQLRDGDLLRENALMAFFLHYLATAAGNAEDVGALGLLWKQDVADADVKGLML